MIEEYTNKKFEYCHPMASCNIIVMTILMTDVFDDFRSSFVNYFTLEDNTFVKGIFWSHVNGLTSTASKSRFDDFDDFDWFKPKNSI